LVVPKGLGSWLASCGRNVKELGWWESMMIGRLEITMAPARRWSRRRIGDTNRSWWGGYVVRAGDHAVYHAGDTAWFMEHHHLNPEQAGKAWLEIGAEAVICRRTARSS